MSNAMLPSRRPQLQGMKRGRHAPRSSSANPTPFRLAYRVFHQKFGSGSVTAIEAIGRCQLQQGWR